MDSTGPTDTTQAGHNLTALKQEIVDGLAVIKAAEEERTGSNADIEAVRARLEAKGINRRALALALAYSKMDEDQRSGFDTAYELVREAIGMPISQQFELRIPEPKTRKGQKANGPSTDRGDAAEA